MNHDTHHTNRLNIELEQAINPRNSGYIRRGTGSMYGTTSVDIIGNAYPKNVTRKMTVPYKCMYIVRISLTSSHKDVAIASC